MVLLAIRRILRDDHPVLRQKTAEVIKINSGVTRLLDDMRETMRDADGVGLAANQVGVSKRILIAADGEETIYELINPCCEVSEGNEVGVEGCLSVPGKHGEVPRSTRIVVAAVNREGRKIRLTAEGLLARILQHEMDHLDGILFIDKALNLHETEEIKSED